MNASDQKRTDAPPSDATGERDCRRAGACARGLCPAAIAAWALLAGAIVYRIITALP